MYKYIFSDLDETLLVDHHVPIENQKAIKKANSQGTHFVVATGRAYNMIQDILKEVGTYGKENEYSLCFNGALIVEHKNNHILYFKGLDFDVAKDIFNRSFDYDVCVLVFTLDCCYIFRVDEREVERKKEQKAPYQVRDDNDFDFLKDEKIAKILYVKRDMSYLRKIKAELLPFYSHVSMTFSSYRYLEFNALNVNKGIALKWLMDYLNININETIAIGDNDNDIEMIQMAGLGVCVQGASDEIKKISDRVMDEDYFENAVAKMIENYVLEE